MISRISIVKVLLIIAGMNYYNNQEKYYVVNESSYVKYRDYNMCFFDLIEKEAMNNKERRKNFYRIVHSAFLLKPPVICNHIAKTNMNMYGYYIIGYSNQGRSTLIANIYVATYENKCWRQNFGSDKVIISEHVNSPYYECGYLSELIGKSVNILKVKFSMEAHHYKPIYVDSHYIYFNNFLDSTYSVLYLKNDTIIGYFTEYNCLLDSNIIDSFMLKLHLNLRRQALR